MDAKGKVRFTIGKQSSMAPDREPDRETDRDREQDRDRDSDSDDGMEEIDPRVRLMFYASEGDLEGIKKLMKAGTDVNFRDIDNRTALHVAACQGFSDVAKLLLEGGADVDPKDKWGSTPLADAIHYKKHGVAKLLEKHGAKHLTAPMHVNNAREIPEYEIDAKELDFTNSIDITKGTFTMASWRGTQVAVKKLGDELCTDEDKVAAFRDELELLQKIRHPNVVQFLGAVTQSSPMMIVIEYLPKGDLKAYLKRKGPLKPLTALKFAMDIARGMSYLHEIKPEPIIHRDLEPSNILLDDSGHLKVADFGVSELLKGTNAAKHKKLMNYHDTSSRRYVAPEVLKNEDYDTKVDVFSFALILQEMIEGCQPFATKDDKDVPKLYAAKRRPPFNAPSKSYPNGLKQLIEECWHENPSKRPSFRQIIVRLESIYNSINHKNHWKFQPLKCFGLTSMCKGDDSDTSSYNRSSRI